MSATSRLAYCPHCGARLRRGQPLKSWCDPCRRTGPDPRRDLPPDFYFHKVIWAALREYEFGPVLRWVREETGWSQQLLGAVIDLEQSQISALERGHHKLLHVRLVSRLAQGLGIPGRLLGFPAFDDPGEQPPPR